jgi:hypothetical protein
VVSTITVGTLGCPAVARPRVTRWGDPQVLPPGRRAIVALRDLKRNLGELSLGHRRFDGDVAARHPQSLKVLIELEDLAERLEVRPSVAVAEDRE